MLRFYFTIPYVVLCIANRNFPLTAAKSFRKRRTIKKRERISRLLCSCCYPLFRCVDLFVDLRKSDARWARFSCCCQGGMGVKKGCLVKQKLRHTNPCECHVATLLPSFSFVAFINYLKCRPLMYVWDASLVWAAGSASSTHTHRHTHTYTEGQLVYGCVSLTWWPQKCHRRTHSTFTIQHS